MGSVMYGKVMAKLEVLYNSECPICDKEIKHYEKISSGKILYTPISPASLGSWGISEGQAAEKLHARLDGKTMVGVDAFLEIWSRLPYYRVLSRIVKMPPIKFVANSWCREIYLSYRTRFGKFVLLFRFPGEQSFWLE